MRSLLSSSTESLPVGGQAVDHQWQSAVISGNQQSSVAISSHQWQSAVISGNQQSLPVGGPAVDHQVVHAGIGPKPLPPILFDGTLDGARVELGQAAHLWGEERGRAPW
jgi:hypothetical protein